MGKINWENEDMTSETLWTMLDERLSRIDVNIECLQSGFNEIKPALNKAVELSNKHEEVLYGDPRNMGKDGLISFSKESDRKADGVGKRIDSMRSTMLLIWSGIFGIIQLAMSGIQTFLHK